MSDTDLNALAERLDAAADHLGDHDLLAPDLRQAAQALRGMVEGWRPIATAPTDGSSFLAFNAFMGIYSTAFTTRWTGEPNEEGYSGFPCGFTPAGTPDTYRFGRYDCQPTFWRPLPEPPRSALKGRDGADDPGAGA